ncbi:LOW QUALITY PROTEIN: hypothetical protein V2J09_007765 [Rumex salicifolius]
MPIAKLKLRLQGPIVRIIAEVGCFLDHWFEINCKASSNPNGKISTKPYLASFNNLEVMEINTYYDSSQITVGLPPINTCVAEEKTPTGMNFTGTPFQLSTGHNVFMVEGCSGNAVSRDETKKIMAGCGTVCRNNNTPAILKNGCNGVDCCQTVISSTNGYLLLYQIDGSPQSCLTATLINNDSANQYIGKLSGSSDHAATAAPPVVLSWSWISKLKPDNNPNALCRWNGLSIYCYCRAKNSFGNAYVSNGCQGTYFLIFSSFLKNVRDVEEIVFRNWMKEHKKLFKTHIIVKTIQKATDHFNENRILDQGGQGTVYKGMLDDGRIVAIKKANIITIIHDPDEVFAINWEKRLKIVLDSACAIAYLHSSTSFPIYHRDINFGVVLLELLTRKKPIYKDASSTEQKNLDTHVVKLFGCCLEKEVPLLVYEFIPNGTLYEHIHDPDEDFALSWDMRLMIAADSVGAIAYLHSSASIPIYHRDIKSSNILLAEKFRAKVSDFGSSMTIAMDQTHLTTLVQGTMGNLDPDFVVVILELLTSKKPIYRVGNIMEQKNLVTEFLFLTQDSRLSNILDPKIVVEAKEDDLNSIVELAKRCVSWSGS